MLKLNKKKVLFLCAHNSVRSQIAEGLLRHFYGDAYEVFSAGSSPSYVHPLAIRVMDEVGIDISKQNSKSVEEFRNVDIDLVISVCKSSEKVACSFCSSPIVNKRPEIINETIPGAKKYLHHPFDDPSELDENEEKKLTAFRQTRNAIKEWIVSYFENIQLG